MQITTATIIAKLKWNTKQCKLTNNMINNILVHDMHMYSFRFLVHILYSLIFFTILIIIAYVVIAFMKKKTRAVFILS